MDIPPPPPPPPSPDDVPPPGPPSYGQNPYQQNNPYADQPTQAAMPGAGPPQQPGYPGPAPGGYGYPDPQYPGAPYPGPPQPQPPAGYGYPGPAAPMPYGQPWMGQPQQRSTNGMSIAALVLGLLPCIPLLGLIFGFIGLSQTKRRGERGKGMAVTGIVGSIAWIAILAVVITIGVLHTGNTNVTALKAGQCFNTVDESLSEFGQGDPKKHTATVDVVKCAKEHDAEAFASYEMQAGDDAPYPGIDGVSRDARTNCGKYLTAYLDGKQPPSGVKVYFYGPSYEFWNKDKRTVVCFFGSADSKLTGSVKSGASTSDDTGGADDAGDDSDVGV